MDGTPTEPAATYRLSGGSRGAAVFIALLFIGLGALIGLLTARGTGSWVSPGPLTVLGVLAALSVLLIVYSWRWRLVLSGDAIELHGLFGVRRLRRAEIAGRRILRGRSGETVWLVPSRPDGKPLRFNPGSIGADARLTAWIHELPDLDARDLRDSEAAVAGDPELGATREERLAQLKSARRNAQAVSFAAIALAVWLYTFPVPYRWLSLAVAVVPWAAFALAARSRGLYRLDTRRNDVRPTLIAAVIAPALALFARALFDIGLLDWPAGLAWAGALAGLFAWSGWRCTLPLAGHPGREAAVGAPALLWLLFGALYGLGAILLGDALLDRTPGQTFSVPVLGQRVSHGKSTSYHLTLAPWGSHPGASEVTVDHSTYQQAQREHRVCVHQGEGALHVPWYVVRGCR
jgi:hypothetical protein